MRRRKRSSRAFTFFLDRLFQRNSLSVFASLLPCLFFVPRRFPYLDCVGDGRHLAEASGAVGRRGPERGVERKKFKREPKKTKETKERTKKDVVRDGSKKGKEEEK